MMTKVTQFLRQYPWVVAATVVGIIGVVANLAVGEQVAIVGALRAIRETNPRTKHRAVDSMGVQRARV